MSDLIKLAEEAVGVYLVGTKIVDNKYTIAKNMVLKESSKMVSSAISFLMASMGIFVLFVLTTFIIGFWASTYYNMPILTLIIPFSLVLINVILLWIYRDKIFQKVTEHLLRDLLP